MENIYFELSRRFNERERIAILASGQAVVYYQIAIMSKDGDWILRESAEGCAHVLAVLEEHRARYRPAAPLDPRWLRGGWSSHFQFFDDADRRVRCDFVTRPPRLSFSQVDELFRTAPGSDFPVLDIESLIAIKKTQRAKDYVVIGALSRRLPPEREIELTTDPDRVVALASSNESSREAAVVARSGGSREEVMVALAREINTLQERDARRVEKYHRAGRDYLLEFERRGLGRLELPEAHGRVIELAGELLPEVLPEAAGNHEHDGEEGNR